MDGYYSEIVSEIQQAIEDGSYEEAYFLLKKELSMPYIPKDVEAVFHSLKKDVQYGMSLNRVRGEESLEELLEGLNGREKRQLLSCEKLMQKNLRLCIDEIRYYLEKDPFPEAAALLVEAIAEQEINDDFTWIKNGVEFNFYGDSVTPVLKSEGFLQALQLLNDYVSSYPSVLDVARKILIHEAMMNLPLSYEADEANILARTVIEQACDMLQDDETKQEILALMNEN